jgi:MFS family permease
MAHTLGMFAFSILTGKLVDRWGRGPVILSGSVMLLASFVLAPVDPSTLSLAAALFLLGLGWNFCFVGGSALLSDQLQPAERSRTQGFNDVFIGLASAVGSYGSGLIFDDMGYGVLNLIAAVIILALLTLVIWWSVKHNPSRKKLTNIE